MHPERGSRGSSRAAAISVALCVWVLIERRRDNARGTRRSHTPRVWVLIVCSIVTSSGLLDQRMDCVGHRLPVLHGRGEAVTVGAVDADVDVLFIWLIHLSTPKKLDCLRLSLCNQIVDPCYDGFLDLVGR